MWFSTYEASYDNLSQMLSYVVARNPGSFYDTYLVPTVRRGQRFLLRAFFCLGACVRAFQYCLPVLCIDGTFLNGRYKGQILTAIEIYCNHQIVPVAFAFVENENTESWYWFLERVKIHVVASHPDVCLISDRHADLLQAIMKLQVGNGTTPPLWPDVQNGWCIRHMGALHMTQRSALLRYNARQQQDRSTRTREPQVLRRPGCYSLQYVFRFIFTLCF